MDEGTEAQISDMFKVTPAEEVMISILPIPRAVLPQKIPLHFLSPRSSLLLLSFLLMFLSPNPALTNAISSLRSNSHVPSSKACFSLLPQRSVHTCM